jgi:hypothetical protein
LRNIPRKNARSGPKSSANNTRYRFDKIPEKLSQWDPAFQYYKQFEEVLNSFGRMFQELVTMGPSLT